MTPTPHRFPRLALVCGGMLPAVVVLAADPALALPELLTVDATVHTTAVNSDADDPAIWIHPFDPSLDRVIGTDKGSGNGGLFVWNMSGQQLQYVPINHPNNVDARHWATIGNQQMDVVVANSRGDGNLRVFRMDPETGLLEDVTTLAGIPTPEVDSYGLCLYRRTSDGRVFVILSSAGSGAQDLHMWRLDDDGTGRVKGTHVAAFGAAYLGSQCEGMVVDDELEYLYVSEEGHGVHKFHVNPAYGNAHITEFALDDGISGDREGLAIYACPGGTGYVLLSSQGNSTVKVYRREGEPENPHLHTLLTTVVTYGSSETDGLDVTYLPAGSTFRQGLLAKHDSPSRSFTLYPWEDISQGWLSICSFSVGVTPELHDGVVLRQNDPNPFRHSTLLRYRLPRAGPANLSLYDLAGARVATLADGPQAAGEHSVVFVPGRLSSGVYFFVLRTASARRTIRALLVK